MKSDNHNIENVLECYECSGNAERKWSEDWWKQQCRSDRTSERVAFEPG